jgi:hypothetical protein
MKQICGIATCKSTKRTLAAKKTIDVFLNTFHFQGAIITYLYPLALFLNFSYRDPKDKTLNQVMFTFLNLENNIGSNFKQEKKGQDRINQRRDTTTKYVHVRQPMLHTEHKRTL